MTSLASAMEFLLDCDAPGCNGTGRIRHQNTRIDPDFIQHHLKHHAYSKPIGGSEIIGANCDCPRVLDEPYDMPCQACGGSGKKDLMLRIPQPGEKVKVVDPQLLLTLLGEDVDPTEHGIVYAIQTPEEHHLELKTGIGIVVSWDKTKDGKKLRTGDIAVWTFDLTEVVLVK